MNQKIKYVCRDVTIEIERTEQTEQQSVYSYTICKQSFSYDTSTNPVTLVPGSNVVLHRCNDFIDVPRRDIFFVATLALDHMVEKNPQLRQLLAHLPEMITSYMRVYDFHQVKPEKGFYW